MMGSNDKSQDEFFYSFDFEDVAPQDHLLRSIESSLWEAADLRRANCKLTYGSTGL